MSSVYAYSAPPSFMRRHFVCSSCAVRMAITVYKIPNPQPYLRGFIDNILLALCPWAGYLLRHRYLLEKGGGRMLRHGTCEKYNDRIPNNVSLPRVQGNVQIFPISGKKGRPLLKRWGLDTLKGRMNRSPADTFLLFQVFLPLEDKKPGRSVLFISGLAPQVMSPIVTSDPHDAD